MGLSVGVEQEGYFQLTISGGARGTIEYPPQKNLILDAGIGRILSNDSSGVLGYISVGSGSTEPAVGQTQLVSKVAHTNRNRALTHGYNSSGGYGWTKVTVQFNQGAAAGNLSELGVGWDGSNLFSRALILNAAEEPATITVLSDEYLTVVYELRSWYIVPASHSITYDYDGVSKTTTVTYSAPPTNVGHLAGFASALTERKGAYFPLNYMTSYGTVSGNTVPFTLTFPINVANTGISSIVGGDGNNPNKIIPFGNQQFCTFSPAISKTNEFEITIQGTYTMSRRA